MESKGHVVEPDTLRALVFYINTVQLKELSHEMDLAFHDMYSMVSFRPK